MKQTDNTVPVKRGRKKKKHGGGRPSKFSPDLVVSLCDLLKKGLSRKDACNALGIRDQTMYNWRKKGELEKDLPASRRTEFFNFWVSVNDIESNIKAHGKYYDSPNSSDSTKIKCQEVGSRTEPTQPAGSGLRKKAPVIPIKLAAHITPKLGTTESIARYLSEVIVKTVSKNPFIIEKQTDKQAVFLSLGIPLRGLVNRYIGQGPNEVFFNGTIHKGKTHGLIMAALQYVNNPQYRALLLRPEYDSLSASMMRSVHDMLDKTRAKWDEDALTWRFPSRAQLSLGYLRTREDNRKFTVGQYQFIGCDDVTSFTREEYLGLFSHLHLPTPKSHIPLRICSTGNGYGLYPYWVRDRFITPSLTEMAKNNRFTVSVTINDLPPMPPPGEAWYRSHLTDKMQALLLDGSWDLENLSIAVCRYNRTEISCYHPS